MKQYEYKGFDLAIKDVSKGVVTGYFASFNTVDSDNEVFLAGAFTKSINENIGRIKHLLDHDTTKAVAKIQVLKEDAQGLYYESKAGTHNIGQDFLKMAESGIITEHSVGFRRVPKKEETKSGINYISEVRLFEGSSLQAWGANSNTPMLGVKSMFEDSAKVEKRIKALEAFCRTTDATDETIELLLLEIKQLTQYIQDLTTPITEPSGDTLPIVKAVNWPMVAAMINI